MSKDKNKSPITYDGKSFKINGRRVFFNREASPG
ncbi:MAG: hypothetical protein DDT32_01450 [Syntrophomonadaceae bacterium]|nr:hypothetical protein [Bacillota bacterium]MBT9147685.1 hypothetical protein [Bacillota bacterium]